MSVLNAESEILSGEDPCEAMEPEAMEDKNLCEDLVAYGFGGALDSESAGEGEAEHEGDPHEEQAAELSEDDGSQGSGRKRRRPEVALISGTSGEFLGRKPLPRAVRSRPLVVLLGPPAVGKSVVARKLLGEGAMELGEHAVIELVTRRVRRRGWVRRYLDAPTMVLDLPCFLDRRPGVLAALQDLLRQRVELGHRTMVCEGNDQGGIGRVVEGISPDLRATIVLRFPEGRGRRRHAVHVCDALGIDRKFARHLSKLEPWTYARVAELLEKVP